MNIECEIRSFIDKERHDELLGYFKKEGEFLGEDNQVTYYFDCQEDLRIQLNDGYAKVWLKKGNLHDDNREEIEIKVDKKDFDELERLFLALGYKIEIKWIRKRNSFKWRGADVSLDFTRGYGYILELEKMSNEENKEETLSELRSLMRELGINISLKEDFDKKYKEYKENWQKLIS